MRLSAVSWITPSQREVLAKHQIVTLGDLASCELRDSLADVVPINDLRKMARRARASLGHADPLAMIGAAAGQSGPVRYAGGVTYGDGRK